MGNPIHIGELTIQSRDLFQGDLDGVQSSPLDLAPRIPEVAARLRAKEQSSIDLGRSPGYTLEKLPAAVADKPR